SPLTPPPRPPLFPYTTLFRSDQSTGDALAATQSLARVADEAGYHRYWLAEHHNMPAVAATNPPLLIALVAGATERIRVGSGGVRSEEHTSELQSQSNLVCRLL